MTDETTLDDVMSVLDRYGFTCGDPDSDCSKARVVIAAALEDARRYRALVDSGAYAPGMRAPCPWALHGSGPLSTKDELDAAIDAAQEVGRD